MELNDSTTDEVREPTAETAAASRSVLCIDLNEIPSPAETPGDSIDVVRSIHDNPSPPPGGPAAVPSAAGEAMCVACGNPEDLASVVVCDACERGFHVGCVGMRGGCGGTVAMSDDWLCGECVSAGEKSKRWPLGAKKRLLDMNASPPSDGDGDAEVEVLENRKRSGSNSFGGHPFGTPASYPNNLYSGNGFGLQKPSDVVIHTATLGFEDILRRSHAKGSRSFEEIDLNFPRGKYRGNNNAVVRKQSRNPSESFLQALREYVYEKNGELEEGWHVEFRQSMDSELYAVYCAPDGQTFGSVSEVACYLGLNLNSKEPEIKLEGGFPMLDRNHLPRKRKARKSVTNGFAENKEGPVGGCYKNLPNGLGKKIGSTFDNNSRHSESAAGESGCFESHNNNKGLPVQFEDFFLISLGKVDTRPSYLDGNFVWPVGFKSYWHDKVTGSLFICEILDGGDFGPIFKVKRVSCSSFPIPTASTVLLRQHTDSVNEESDNMSCDDDDGSLQIICLDPCPPMENDVLSCLNFGSSGGDAASSIPVNSKNITSCEMDLVDEIGVFSVEEKSSSSAWKIVAEKIVNACAEILKRKGTFDTLCKHITNDGTFPNYATENKCSKGNHESLDKFSSALGFFRVQSVMKTDKAPNSFKDALEKWLDQDRFGLDMDFVQEIVEQLPGFQTCSRYQTLSERSSASSVTAGNGLIVLKRKGGLEGMEKETSGLFRRLKKAKVGEGTTRGDHRRPIGRKLCSTIPSELAGDAYQVWEMLWRFYEILGLKEPLSLEELEEELLNPWSNNGVVEKFEKDIRGSQALNSTDSTVGQTLNSISDSSHAFIQMATGAMKEEAQTKLASLTYTKCSGVALTKAHKSLLSVLIGELQTKVAALVDPNFDSGESKSKRGRKKDVDSSISAKRTKLSILPINELTWPELARRYILAFLSMDGNLDSGEIIARESGKVFRCLQGDGGVLCGSLTGVAGMEADALLLAEARKQIFGSWDKENDVLTFEDDVPDATGATEKNMADNTSIPEWALVLEPVRKLPTNVGTRIRRCVHEALAMDPPEWAKKILEHSISKEVYKGNASGPTKKAVLSVLAEVSGEVLSPKPKPDNKRKKKTVIPISDVIMKQCRIVLRRTAAADDSKVFCNLLGRKLTASSDNDDEGLLGSPGTVSRPLDFRTIDLRLAAGAYCGSHETFLEDVRELWINIRNAFGDQPDLVELAETLSQNFETLYEDEVLPLVAKLTDFAKLECLNAEAKKEVDELLSSISVIPKAPWDDGVCKVCGIDRDDDSVLLCDTCDAEYHTYCLNPPLARIPEGNWYCPSCVLSKRIVAPENVQVIRQRSGRKYQGEVTRVYLEGLSQLATKMEEKEYWEFTVDERTYLLKFLCDELLNSAIIRQHLEQCAETSAELQQKLRSLFVEWKILKSREDILVSRAAKLDSNAVNSLGAAGTVETLLANNEKGQTQSLSDKSNCCGASADDVLTLGGGREGAGPNALDRHSSASDSPNSPQNPLDADDQLKDGHTSVVDSNATGNPPTNMDSQKNDKSASNSLLLEVEASVAETSATDTRSTGTGQHANSNVANELQAYHIELNSIKNEIAVLQGSITSVESELLKVSVRREFLGKDSLGCLYWASGTPAGHYCIVVDGSAALWHVRKTNSYQGPMRRCRALESSLRSVVDNRFSLLEQNNAVASLSVAYQTEEEIDELVKCLTTNDPIERELRESITHWQRLRFQEFRKSKSQGQSEVSDMSVATNGKDEIGDYLATRASNLLEKWHGACVELETSDPLKMQGKKGRITTNEDKMFRCECLELVWPCRHHCNSCHRTFSNDIEFKGHNEGNCSSTLLAHEKGKETSDSSKTKGNPKPEMSREGHAGETSRVEIPQIGFPELGAKLIKFQDEGSACPYDLDKICSKFMTNDSCKDLISEIGLIGSNGVMPFVPSVSPLVSDSTLALISSKKNTSVECDGSEAAEREVHRETANEMIGGLDVLSGMSLNSTATRENNEVLRSQRTGNRTSGSCSMVAGGITRCCVVPQSSLRPLVGKVSQILRRLKINLLDMDAALHEESLRLSKAHLGRRWAWRSFVKSATTIYEMVQATMILEDMIKTDSIKNEWWSWSSFSAAAKTASMSSLALRIYSLDAAIIYEKNSSDLDTTDNPPEPTSLSEQKQPPPVLDPTEKTRITRRSNKKRKELEG